jgi:NADH dehydrogenase FAD-containing subunit
VPADLVVWTAGTRAPDLFRDSGLPTDPHGFLLVEETLQASGVPEVFAAGDAASLVTAPQTPKAGVYAVRQAPVLVHNLSAALGRVARGRPAGGAGNELRAYHPQSRFLALLNTGDGRAIFSYGDLALAGRWAMHLKDWIDRGFMRRFQRLYDTGRHRSRETGAA